MNSTDVKIMTAQYSAAAITFVSEGNSSGAIARLDATINLFPGRKVLTGIVGCDGISLSGSGVIDSFDSTKGAYKDDIGNGDLNYGDRGDAATLSASGDVTLDGSSPVYGNVSAGGTFASSGSSVVMGNVSANGNVTVTADSNAMKDRENNVIEHAVNGDVNSGGDAILNNKKIAGNVNAKGEATGTLHVAGITTAKDGVVDSAYQGPNIDIKEKCDNIGLGTQRTDYKTWEGKGAQLAKKSGKTDANYDFTDWQSQNTKAENGLTVASGVEFVFDADTAESYNKDYDGTADTELTVSNGAIPNVDFLGESDQNVHVFDDFILQGQDIYIKGGKEVKILVTGDFITKGASSNIKVEKGSSLSIVVLGKIATTDGLNIVEVGTGNSVEGQAAVNIYSAYEQPDLENGYGVDLMGTDINATLNAPFSKVHVKAAGSFQGAMRGKEITVSGAGGVHFDEKLLKGKPPIDPSASIAAITYHYE